MDSVRKYEKPLIPNRLNPSTEFTKMPSYIVAFSLHETYDDIVTAQQMICNKRSLQGSQTSVSPTVSTKTISFEQNLTNKLVDTDQVDDNLETKINIDETENDKCIFLEAVGPSITEDCINTILKTLDSVLTTNESSVKDNNEDTNNVEPDMTIAKNEHFPQICKRKKKSRNKVKNIHFKYKKILKNEHRRSAAIMKDTILTNSLSHVLSRSILVSKKITKENIHELEDSILLVKTNFDEDSLQWSPSTIKKSFMSNSSQNTIRQVSSSSLKNEISNLDQKISSKELLPYGKDIVNVSVAVTYNPSPVNNDEYKSPLTENLVSTDTLVFPSISNNSDDSQNKQSMNPSNKTLTLEKKYSDLNSVSTNKTFLVGNKSSELGNINMNSDDTLTPHSETFIYSENLKPMVSAFDNPEIDKKYNRTALLDTVVNMGLLPEMNASTSSAIYFSDNYNNVYVTGDSNKLSRNTKYKENVEGKLKNSQNMLSKPFEKGTDLNKYNDITFPNDSALKTTLTESDKYCSGELGTYPKNINELWDRLVSVMDKAVKRLEDSLTEKIITEMRKSFTVIESNVNTLTQKKIFVGNQLDNNIFFSNKGILVEPKEISQSQNLQCNLVGNQIIDNIMLKLSTECPKIEIPKNSCKSLLKIKEPNILKDYFKVLKAPMDKTSVVDTNKGDTATISTAVASELETIGSFHRVKSLFVGPLIFVRENFAIIASVPAFFIVLLFAYGLLVLLMKPW